LAFLFIEFTFLIPVDGNLMKLEMDESRKRPLVDDIQNGSNGILFGANTLDERPSPRKRRRHSSGCSLDLSIDDVNGIGNKAVNFILKSDSEDETDWNQTSINNAATLPTPVEEMESRSFFNQAESAKDLALKAFRRVDSTASELNCLADPNLSENVVETPDDSRDPFSSLVNRGFIRTESVGSDLKRLVSNPGSDILSPDIFKGELQGLKNHDNTLKERMTEPIVPKQNANDLVWMEECPDWLRDDYFDKEMSKMDSGLPRQSSKLSLVDKEEDSTFVSSGNALHEDKLKTNLPVPDSVEFDRNERKKSVTLSVETDAMSSNDLGFFEPDKDLNDAQSNVTKTKLKKLKMRKRHCSRGKMGPPAYYNKNLPSRSEQGEEVGGGGDVFVVEEDFSQKGRGKNWPPKSYLDNQASECPNSQSQSEIRLSDDTGSTQEYEIACSQEKTNEMRGRDHNDNMHINSMTSCDDKKSSQITDENVDGSQLTVGENLDISAVSLNLERVENNEHTTNSMEEGLTLDSDVVTDAIPYDETDASVIPPEPETQPSISNPTSQMTTTSNSINPVSSNYSINQNSSTAKVSLEKIPSLRRDAQNIANILGGSNVDVIYEQLNERRKDDNRVESVMNDILEGNILVEGGADVERGSNTIDNVEEGMSGEVEGEVDIFSETQIILKKLQEEHEMKDIDPNELFGLVERCAETFNSRTSRINRVIFDVLAMRRQSEDIAVTNNKNDDEDLFLHDVDQLVKNFPDVDQFQIYMLLDAHRGEDNRVDVVLNELKGRVPAGNAGIEDVAEVEIVNEDPLYNDMMQIARLFPHKDRNEIYAYLEAHHNEAYRVQVVTEEFLRMSQDVEVINEEPASRPSSTPASKSNYIADTSVEEHVHNLLAIFPDCDPKYLSGKLEEMKKDPYRVKNLASTMFDHRNYPKKKDVEEEQRKHNNRLKAVGMLSTFRLNEFLELFPEPASVFYGEEKEVSETYKKHVFVHLMNTFPYLQENHIKAAMEKHKNHLTTTLKELEEEVASADREYDYYIFSRFWNVTSHSYALKLMTLSPASGGSFHLRGTQSLILQLQKTGRLQYYPRNQISVLQSCISVLRHFF
jgi:hypothetical protein